MKNARTRLAFLVVLTYFLFTGCKKVGSSTDLTPQKEEEIATLSAVSETESQTIFDDVFDNVLGVNTEVGVGSIGVFGRLSPRTGLRETGVDSIAPCVAVSITRLNAPDLFPARVVLDFGNGCLGKDGHWRYGKMITEYTGRLIVGGKSATTSFNGFKLDSTSVEGSYKITNTASAAGERQFTIDITAANLSKPSGNFIQWSSHKVISQTAGMATPDQPLDKVVVKTGIGSVILETDAPYLAPVPYRGKRNEPSYTKLVADKLSVICGLELQEVAEITSRNAEKLFKK